MKIRIRSSEIEVWLDTVAGIIHSIRDVKSGREHYWRYDPAVWSRRTSICFPICGRLIDDSYRYGGKTYSLPPHGFLREREMQIIHRCDDSVTMSLEDDAETRLVYPFSFVFTLTQRVRGRTLEIIYDVKAPEERGLLFSVGSHYTYALPAPQEECCFQFSKVQDAGRYLLKDGFVAGQSADIFGGMDKLSMDGLFDDTSTILEMKDLDTDYIAISTKDKIFTALEYEGFDHLVLWAPKGGHMAMDCRLSQEV